MGNAVEAITGCCKDTENLDAEETDDPIKIKNAMKKKYSEDEYNQKIDPQSSRIQRQTEEIFQSKIDDVRASVFPMQHEPDQDVAVQNVSLESKIVQARKKLDSYQITKIYNDQLMPDYAEKGPMEYIETKEIYHGQYMERQRFGAGQCLYPENSIYYGQWVNDKQHGTGFMMYANQKNSYYFGNFKDGKRHGTGEFTFQSDEGKTIWIYKGDFEDDKMTGKGEKQLFMQDKIYQGVFADGKLNGKGKILWKIKGHKYIGDCKDNIMHGTGTFHYQNGSKYIGQWLEGKKDGLYCEFIEGNTKYVGDYVNDKKEGQGCLYIDEYLVYRGGWENDQKHGEAQVYDRLNNEKSTNWVNGSMLRESLI